MRAPSQGLALTNGAGCSPGCRPHPLPRPGMLAAPPLLQQRLRRRRCELHSAAVACPGWRFRRWGQLQRPPGLQWLLPLPLVQGSSPQPHAGVPCHTRQLHSHLHPPPGRRRARPGRHACCQSAPLCGATAAPAVPRAAPLPLGLQRALYPALEALGRRQILAHYLHVHQGP